MVLTTCLKALVAKRSSPFMLACWRHNLATALICQRLSDAVKVGIERLYRRPDPRIGQLAFLDVFPAYEKALVSAEEREIGFIDIERELFGLDHGEAGAWLLAQWGCPLELQNVAAKHEDPPGTQSRDGNLIRLVHAASALANLMGMSVIESARFEDLAQVAALLPEASSELTASSFGSLPKAS